MMDWLADIVGWACVVGGGFFLVAGGVGLMRMPDFFTRMHAASMTDTLGAGLLLVALMTHAGLSQATVKLTIISVFILLTSPAAAHALAKAALHGRLQPKLHTDGAPRA